jgi:hypothetical protein
VDLLHSVSDRHALSGPRLFARERSRIDSMLQASPSIRPALHLLRPTYPPEGSGTDNLSLGAPLKHSLIQSFVHERAADFQGNVVAEM